MLLFYTTHLFTDPVFEMSYLDFQ